MVKIQEFMFDNKIYKISIGENAKDNWNLIDSSCPDDIWFHTSDYPSSHVVVETINPLRCVQGICSVNSERLAANDVGGCCADAPIPKQVIIRCCCICKANSKAKSINNAEIIYTSIKNISKTNIVGQVTTKNVKSIKI
jgi:predicted ribosome quality control (RQC) complex YloA/Tae2 family protein